MMNLSWLTLRDLEYLIALGEHLHFGKAAAACHVSQPALSQQIAKLERLLGLSLLERSQRKVSLTAAGKEALQIAHQVLQDSQRFSQLGEKSQLPFGGVLRIGAIATLGPYYMPHLLPVLRTTFPQLRLSFEEGLTEGLLAQLRAGELDIVLCADTFAHTGFKIFPLFEEPLYLAAPKSHALLNKEPLRVSDLTAKGLVVLKDGHCLKDQALGYCRLGKSHKTPKRGPTFDREIPEASPVQAASLESLRHLVAAGEGYTLIPFLAIRPHDPLDKLLSIRPFSKDKVGRDIVMTCRTRYPYFGILDSLAQQLRAHLPPGVSPLELPLPPHGQARRRPT